LAVVGAPLTFDEAIESNDKKKWRASMDEEIDAHHRNKTWKLVPRPVEVPVIDNKWIYKYKNLWRRKCDPVQVAPDCPRISSAQEG